MTLFELKQDTYRETRGTYSRLLNLFCRECGTYVATYQKDGPGNLRRLYLDRIHAPSQLARLHDKSLRRISSLKCKKCEAMLGTPYSYRKEHRKAFKLYQDAITKKVISRKIAHPYSQIVT